MATIKLVKTTILDMGITIEITGFKSHTRIAQPPFKTLLTVRLLVVLSPFSNSSHKSSMTFSFQTFYSFAVFQNQYRG